MMVSRAAVPRLRAWRDCVKCVITQRQPRSRPDGRRIVSAAVCLTSCKRASFAVSACPGSGIGAGPARADGTVVTAGASPGRNGAASFRSSCHGACAVTHGHQPRADYLVVSAHIGPKISAMITRVSSVIRPEGLGDLRSPV